MSRGSSNGDLTRSLIVAVLVGVGAAKDGDEVVITSRGKPIALLVGVADGDLEETLRFFRRAKAQAAVSPMRDSAEQGGLADMDQAGVEAEIAAARSERARR